MNELPKNYPNILLKLTAIMGLFFTLIFLQQYQDSLIFDHEKITSGEVWRLWSGQFIHTNDNHLLMNALAIAMLVLIYRESLSLLNLSIQTLYLSSCVGLGIYFISPDILKYAGLSGITYGLFATSALFATYQKDEVLGYVVFFAITGKIIWENIDSSINDSSATLINAIVATDAHLYGYLAALVFSAICITVNDKQQKEQ